MKSTIIIFLLFESGQFENVFLGTGLQILCVKWNDSGFVGSWVMVLVV